MPNFCNQTRAATSLVTRLKRSLINPTPLARPRCFTTAEGHRPTIVHKRSLDSIISVVDLKRLEVQARDGPSDPNALAK
ncbi:hypothetical protein CRYUN_Cryun01aG0021400 [Craigia yunnanensis]